MEQNNTSQNENGNSFKFSTSLNATGDVCSIENFDQHSTGDDSVSQDIAGTVPVAKLFVNKPAAEEKAFPEVIYIRAKSPLMPPNVVFIGTGSAEKKYMTWLKAKLQSEVGRKSSSFAYLLAYIAVAEDEVEHQLGYVYAGPRLPRPIDVATCVRVFVQENKSFLQTLAPYFGIKKTAAPDLAETPAEQLPLDNAPVDLVD